MNAGGAKETSGCRLDDQRTQYAWRLVDTVGNRQDRQNLAHLAAGLPVTLRTRGGLQTLLFFLGRQDRVAEHLATGMLGWLRECPLPLIQSPPEQSQGWIEVLITAERSIYRVMEQELLALAQAIKLLSHALEEGMDHEGRG